MSEDRVAGNWIETYLDYVDDTEPAKVFHRWVSISMIAAVLRKKVCLIHGRLKYFPNLYIILVAEPGQARKSQAINFGLKFLTDVPDVHTSADSTTREALLDDLENCAVEDYKPDGQPFKHTSITIVAKELESFMGQKQENTKMIVLLTDLFDAQEIPWKYRTKNSGTNIVPSVFINMIGATTPESLASCFPTSAIGGGLTSRVLFVWAQKKEKKVAKPLMTERVQNLEDRLQQDLFRISKINGYYFMSQEADDWWEAWYNRYEELDPNRICLDRNFDGWYSRKPMYILKVAQVCAAAESSELTLHIHHLQQAIEYVEETETYMGKVFRAVGRSTITADVDAVMEIILAKGIIEEGELMSLVWRDIDSSKFDNVIATGLRTKKIIRVFKYQGVSGIFYASQDFVNATKAKKEEGNG